MADNRNAVQFYCDDEEYATLTKAAEKEFRSIASFAKASTLKTAQNITQTTTPSEAQ